jgi:hypothetical protein
MPMPLYLTYLCSSLPPEDPDTQRKQTLVFFDLFFTLLIASTCFCAS